MLLNDNCLDNDATFKKLKYVYLWCVFYCNLFYHQPIEGLSIIINTIKLFTKKRNISLDNISLDNSHNENKDIKYIN